MIRLERMEQRIMGTASDFSNIPMIDVGELAAGSRVRLAVAERLGQACRESGFFYHSRR